MENLINKEHIKFDSPEKMLDYICGDCDLYNLETGDYIWKYTECGSIAVDNFSLDEAERLEQKAIEEEMYWGGLIYGGSIIYDDPSHDLYEEYYASNLDYCKEVYDKGTWVDVSH